MNHLPENHPENKVLENQAHSSLESSRPTGSRKPKSILIVETERLPIMRKVISRTAANKEFAGASITILCNDRRKKFYLSGHRITQALTYSSRGLFPKIAAAVRLIFHAKKYDLVVTVFNGQRHFRKTKLLFWFMRARKRMVFDGKLDSFLLSPGTFPRLFSRKRKPPYRLRRINVLVFETDSIEILREVARITRGDQVIPGARITVFCRDSSVEKLKGNPHINKIISYPDHNIPGWFKAAAGTILARNEVIVGVFNGRKRFFLSKLLFCLCRNRHRLVFNGALDCCFWNRHTYGRIIMQGLKAGVNSPFANNPREVLVLETAGPETMKKMIRIAAEPKVNPLARITLFCNESRRETFSSMTEITNIVTYSDASLREKISDSVKIIFTYPDAVVARFNGGRDFKPLKTLFWLVRTPNRIVFNETLDCFYLNRKTARLLLFRGKGNLSDHFLVSAFRQAVKGTLFIPRFAYLLFWRAAMVLRFMLKRKSEAGD